MSTTDLVSRFDAVSAFQNQENQEQALKKMSFEELGQQTILFGEAKKGQKFGQVVQKDPTYCRWFLKKWGNSLKAEHRMFCQYLMMWVERKEATLGLENPEEPQTGNFPASSNVCPKAKAKSFGRPSMPPIPIDLELEDDECWDHLTQQHGSIKEDETEARSSGRGTERSGESTEDVVSAPHRSSELQLATNAETFLIEQCIREYNHFHNNPGNNNHPVFVGQTRQPYQQNMILKEMMQFGVSNGWIAKDGSLIGPQHPGIDSLEIYCSSESQLTKQCIRQGLRAMRFGLREGDLSNFEGRAQLYHVLFKYRPPNI